ncbi:cbb3-type cytochrome oxidase assembly protein CcoS [Natronospira bacteriovora]|uniref:Cbb3-type cytochrome oxidase assembly protein CcoS n=1 Tax=Natronospira bacteriovora TaxID=3069753 RepID=A0ABU0W8P3_9GAMM|nr:cbb3-type cytochrome oxidase assembly protein CcoS [Natronospira sp. AB-CW4]MDQ2070406.1 cbb3-type cytochrome oxidase assembly protein CcoS [Natronospira sp. AB-CW4]
MNIIFVSIPIGIILIGLAIAAFFWAVRSGQYDDLDSPAWSVLMDEDREERRHRRASRGTSTTEADSEGRDGQEDDAGHGR